MSDSVPDLASRVAKLSPQDRKAFDALLGTAAPVQPEASPEQEVLVWEIIQQVLRLRGVSRTMPYTVLRRQRFFKQYRDGCGIAGDFVRQYCGTLKGGWERKAWRVCIDALLRKLKTQKIPIGPMTISQNLGRIPDIIEDAFPGYRESGMLPYVISKSKVANVE